LHTGSVNQLCRVDYSIRLNSRIGQSAFPAGFANQVRLSD